MYGKDNSGFLRYPSLVCAIFEWQCWKTCALLLECGVNVNATIGVPRMHYLQHIAWGSRASLRHLKKYIPFVTLLIAYGLDPSLSTGGKTALEILMEPTELDEISLPVEAIDIWNNACSTEAVQKLCFKGIKRYATVVAIALQDLNLPAWCTLEIILASCGYMGHQSKLFSLWSLVTKVKHWKQQSTTLTKKNSKKRY